MYKYNVGILGQIVYPYKCSKWNSIHAGSCALDLYLWFDLYLMYIHHTWVNSLSETTDDLILFVGHCDLYFVVE